MKGRNTGCRRFQKRRDWIRQRLKFTVKITFFDAAIGSKNCARQQYFSNGLGTVDQPLHHEQQWVLQQALFKVARLDFFGGYLPSLSINYVAMSKDMEKRLPQLYYIKMKISYDLGFIAIGVAMAT